MAVSRNTAECLARALDSATKWVPELKAFENDFQLLVRMPIVDRFSSNFKTEKHMKCRQPELISALFSCDVHKISGSIKRGLGLSDDTLSGLVNVALALEATGNSLERMRSILQDIFENELTIAFDNPPGEDSEEFLHRQAIYDLFLPFRGPKSKKRRFVLQCFCNGNLEESEVVHFCPFGCCRTPELCVQSFKEMVAWALLPSKMPVLNRKSWTGTDVALEWCGLLHLHYHLLPRILLRMFSAQRPLAEPLEDTMNIVQPRLTAVADDMTDFERLYQDFCVSNYWEILFGFGCQKIVKLFHYFAPLSEGTTQLLKAPIPIRKRQQVQCTGTRYHQHFLLLVSATWLLLLLTLEVYGLWIID